MSQPTRSERLATEMQALSRLADQSSILDCRAEGTPPHRILLTFQGKGYAPDESRGGDPIISDRHVVELSLPFAFPEQEPEIRFQTPLFHPAVSLSGWTSPAALGLDWNDSFGLEILAERLWEVIRAANFPPGRPQLQSAADWFAAHPIDEPVDPRRLRDLAEGTPSNIIRYRPRSQSELGGQDGPGTSGEGGSAETGSLDSRGPDNAGRLGSAPPVVDPTSPQRPVVPVPNNGIRWQDDKRVGVGDDGIVFVDEQADSTGNSPATTGREHEPQSTDDSLVDGPSADNRPAPIVFLERNSTSSQ
ncbi:MAG: hypothetical protein KDA83_04180 [Planctomycetales bacterium]|nr:hypothetical protein [Planctomycetales bacterium]